MNQKQFNRANEINAELIQLGSTKKSLERLGKPHQVSIYINDLNNPDGRGFGIPECVMPSEGFISACLVNIEEQIYRLEKEFDKL